MKRSTTRSSSGNPFLMWSDLVLKSSEMMLASAQVIGQRTARMAVAGPNPDARDRREFSLMGQEKIEAAVESAQAMATQMMTINLQLGARAARQLLTGATDMMSLANSRTAGQSMARQAKLARTITQSAATATQLASAAARVASSGLKPIHSRAMANARRLATR